MTDHFTVLANAAGSDNSMQGCRGDGISIPIPIIISTEKHVGIPTEYPQNKEILHTRTPHLYLFVTCIFLLFVMYRAYCKSIHI